MPLWDFIRNWFVTNIWGGHYLTVEGYWMNEDKRFLVYGTGNNVVASDYGVYTSDFKVLGDMCLGDWLSTTSTILVLVAVCVGLFFLTRYFFRMFAGLISGR